MLRNSTTPPAWLGQDVMLAERYRIEREIGRGGMAVVYLAHDTRHDRKVAIKFIGDEVSSAVGTQRFLQEIRLTAALQHPHVLSVYDSGVTHDSVLYYVMPFVEGGSLRARMDGGPLPVADAVKVARNVADALTYAHQRGIVHRDIKPENILFSDGIALVADFGIARLVTDAANTNLTVAGVVVGTPAYMSPEQAFGGTVDARADVYSLACVIYEMLAGRVPFDSPAAGTWTEFGLSRIPASLRATRPEVPEAVEPVLVRALAPSPNDRHPSARDFADALGRAVESDPAAAPTIRTGTTTRSRRARRSGMLLGIALGVAALVAGALFSPAFRTRLITMGVVDMDPTLVMVAPFLSPADTGAGAEAERRLRLELSRWQGVQTMSSDAARDVLGPDEDQLTLDRVVRGARQARAGLVLWGRVTQDGARPGGTIETHILNPRSGAIEATHTLAAESTDSAWTKWATFMAAELLGGQLPDAALRALGATRSAEAWRLFVRGHRALSQWRLQAADSAFAAAVAADPRFAAANVWLAQTMVWNRRGSRAEWGRLAGAALLHAGTLHPDDLAVARAIEALSRRDDPRACTEYAQLVRRDSLDPRGWLGLGDCQAIDSLVVRDARSPSGFSFRGSPTRALAAYEHAVQLNPGAYSALPSAYVDRLFVTQSDRYRPGVGAHDSTTRFAARPAPLGDSVVYVPQLIVDNSLPGVPRGYEEALHRNRARMLEYVAAWTQRVPGSMHAFEVLAAVQEGRGELTGMGARGRLGALAALDSAQQLAGEPEVQARLAASRVRVLVKAGEFEQARSIVDSLMKRSADVTEREAHWLAGLAALTGRTREAARLAVIGGTPPVGWWDTLPAPVGQAATLLLVRAAAGACTDEFRESFRQIESLIDSYSMPAERPAMRTFLTSRASRLAIPCLGASRVAALPPRSIWDRMQHSLGAGDPEGVRIRFDSLQLQRRYTRPGGLAVDFTFMESWLLAASGDSLRAARQLDLTLGALPTLNRHSVWELAQAAALVRTMVWRADLARASGDVQNSTRWAAAAAILWKNADAELQPTVVRMRKFAEAR